jgi:2'-5' RNA ligase
LTFIGDIDPAAMGPLVSRLERAAARTRSFDLTLGGPGRFGHRVLYLGVDGQVAAIRRLAQRTTAATRRAGLAVPEEHFRPHVTLARARQRIDLRPVVAALPPAVRAPTWSVREIVMVHSRLGPNPQHEVLVRFPLDHRHLGSSP